MAPNGGEKAFTVIGRRCCRLLEKMHFRNIGEYGPFCKSKTGGKRQEAKEETGENREGEDKARKEKRKRLRRACKQEAFRRAREEDRTCSNIIEDEVSGGGTPG